MRIHSVVEEFGPVKGYFYCVRETELENLVPTDQLKKVFNLRHKAIRENTTVDVSFMIKLTASFDYS